MDKEKTKAWFQSKTILLAVILAVGNALVLVSTYIRPTFESVQAETPRTPVTLWILLILNIVFNLAIAYTRKVADKKIS